MALIHFSSSETFFWDEGEPMACEHAAIELPADCDYIEGTYEALRVGPNGDEIAWLIEGAWELEDGRRFSDWAVAL